MTEPRIATRLYLAAELAPGARVDLEPGQAHYLRDVLRLKPGATLAAFNARDGEWLAHIDVLGRGRGSLAVENLRRPPAPEPDIWLVFAPIKRAPIDFLVQKATELGCTLLQPVITRHTAVTRVNCARLAANAREAAEQCGRLSLPEVRAPRELGPLLADWPTDRRLLLCAEAGPARPIGEVLAGFAADPAAREAPWAAMTGPEGGFAESELDALRKLPFVTPVGLGPRLLRADTAALAALACWQAVLGDGGGRPAFRVSNPGPNPD
ncbi:MAG: 16S rRNA (uracil(1498)-N(3))-methyltransferase [Alphaproteobacteria bacterium]